MTAPSLLDELAKAIREAYRAGFIAACKWPEPVTQDVDSSAYNLEFNTWSFSVRKKHAEIADMVKRIEAAERDAARYRWLRDKSLGQWEDHPICVSQERSPLGMSYVAPLISDSLDAAIDAAMHNSARESEMTEKMTLQQVRDKLASWLGGSEACLDARNVALLESMVSACDARLAQAEEWKVPTGCVLVAIERGEGYEDVHPELVAEDCLHCATERGWRYSIIHVPPQPEE